MKRAKEKLEEFPDISFKNMEHPDDLALYDHSNNNIFLVEHPQLHYNRDSGKNNEDAIRTMQHEIFHWVLNKIDGN